MLLMLHSLFFVYVEIINLFNFNLLKYLILSFFKGFRLCLKCNTETLS